MDGNELKYWIAFNRIPRIGRVRFKLLEDRFSSLAKAWEASASELVAAGLDDSSAKQITTRGPKIDPDVELQRLVEAGIQAVTWHDSEYPPRLREVYDLPPVLYVRGTLLPEDERSVAVVGTRRPSAYGREVAYRLTSDLAPVGQS